MLLGQYRVRLDEKSRLAIPKKFREETGSQLIITQGYENCLILIRRERWQELIKEITEPPLSSAAGRDTRRFLLGGAFEVELDDQGRLVVPQTLRDFAGIEGETVCLGVGKYLEIWDSHRWQEYQKYLDKHIEKIAEKLSQA